MAWLWSEGRGPAWKRGWTRNAMASMSAPPSPLLAILLIIFLLLYLSSHASYSHQMQQTTVNLKLFLLFLPVILILVAQFVYRFDRLVYPNTKAGYGSVNRSWDMPWGVLGLVVLLLVMISYRSSLQSMWSPIVRRHDY